MTNVMESSSDDSDLVGSSRARPRGGGASGADSGDGAKDDGAIRSALHFAVGRICEREEDDDLDVGARMSSTAVSSLTELVYQYATTSLANDLVAFSKHAGRKTVTVDDVKLAIRKDKKTHDSLGRFCEKKGLASFTSTSAAAKGRKKKKASSAKAASGAKRSKTAKSAGNAGTSTKRKSKNEERRQEMRQHINAASSSDSDSMEPSGGDEDSSDDDDSCLQPVKTPIRKKAASNVENDTTDGGETDDMVIDLASD